MLALEVAILLASVINLFTTIAIAGSIMKLIRIIQVPQNRQNRPNQQLVELPNQPTYADLSRFEPSNYDGFNPQPANWDGVPRARE